MRILIDTNVLLRLTEPAHASHADAVAALRAVRAAGHVRCVVPQVCYEFWVVATKPIHGGGSGGLGLTTARARQDVLAFQTAYTFLADTPAIFPEWLRLVVAHDTKGKPAHDARLVAAMNVHGVGGLLTFNAKDFRRYQPAIRVLDPASVAASGTP